MKNHISSIFLMLCALAVFGQGIHQVWSIDHPEYVRDIGVVDIPTFDISKVDTAITSADSTVPAFTTSIITSAPSHSTIFYGTGGVEFDYCGGDLITIRSRTDSSGVGPIIAVLSSPRPPSITPDLGSSPPMITLSDDAKMGFRVYEGPIIQTMPSRQAETAITGGWPVPENPQVIYEGSLPKSLDKQFYIIAGEKYLNYYGRLYPIGDDDVARLIHERASTEDLYSTTPTWPTTTVSVGEIVVSAPVESSGIGTQTLPKPDQTFVGSGAVLASEWVTRDTSFIHPSPIQNESLYYWQGRWWDTEALMDGKTDFKFRCSLKFEKKGRFATKVFFENVNINDARMMRIRQLMRLDGYVMGWDGYICEAVPFMDDCYDETDAKRLRDTLLRVLLKSQHVK